MEKRVLTDEEFNRIKNYVGKYSFQDIVRWLEDMLASDVKDERLFDLINYEYLSRIDRKELTDEELKRTKAFISRNSYIGLFTKLVQMISSNNSRGILFKVINEELANRGSKGMVSEEDLESIKNYFASFLYTDLIMWQSDLMNSGNINNQVYILLEKEIKRREEERLGSKK